MSLARARLDFLRGRGDIIENVNAGLKSRAVISLLTVLSGHSLSGKSSAAELLLLLLVLLGDSEEAGEGRPLKPLT